MKVETLDQFYKLMYNTKVLRKKIVSCYFENISHHGEVYELKDALKSLEAIPERDGKRYLRYRNSNVYMDIDYEIEELKKDIYFLEQGEEMFFSHLNDLNKGFFTELEKGVQFLQGLKLKNFITDRDGTVNNYCGRYRSSIQSVYNSVFLTRFAKIKAENSLILSSAPLQNGGLLDVSVNPDGIFIYSGSKGREYVDKKGVYNHYPVDEKRQKLLDLFNRRIENMVSEPEYEIFSLIGSGVQFKVGQTTIARQDIYRSIPEQMSETFMKKIKEMVRELDPESNYLRIEDTGKDIEIIVTVEKGKEHEAPRDFNKGDGVKFIDRSLGLGLEKWSNLVCGDTESDIPMLKAVLEKSPSTRAIFVTQSQELKEKISKVCSNVSFVTGPDVLVSILNQTAMV